MSNLVLQVQVSPSSSDSFITVTATGWARGLEVVRTGGIAFVQLDGILKCGTLFMKPERWRTRTRLCPSRRDPWALGWAGRCRTRTSAGWVWQRRRRSPGAAQTPSPASARTRGRRVRVRGSAAARFAIACVLCSKKLPLRLLLLLAPVHPCLVHPLPCSAWRTSNRAVSGSRVWTCPTCCSRPMPNSSLREQQWWRPVQTIPTSSRRTCAVFLRALWRPGPAVRQETIRASWPRLRRRTTRHCRD
jgi:hypothetical protein